GEVQAGQATLRQAHQAAVAIGPAGQEGGIWPHPIIQVAGALAETGNREAADQTFREAMKLADEELDGRAKTDWRNLVSIRLRTQGRTASRDTVEAYHRFIERDPRQRQEIPSYGLTEMIGSTAESGDYGRALQIVHESMQGPEHAGNRCAAMRAIVEAIQEGDRQVAGPILVQARRIFDMDESDVQLAQDVAVIAQAQARIGLFREAMATAREIISERIPLIPGTVKDAKFQQASALV